LPPRVPGEGMWPHLVEADDRRRQAEDAATAAAAAAAAAAAEDQDSAEEAATPAAAAAEDKAVADVNGEVGELEAPEEPAPLLPDSTHNILVMGAPFSLAPRTAAALAEKYQVPVLSVDECVTAAAAAFSDVGDAVRRDLGLSALPGQQELAPATALETRDADTATDVDAATDVNAGADADAAVATAAAKLEGAATATATTAGEVATATDEVATAAGDVSGEAGKLSVITLTAVLAAEIAGRFAGGFLVDGLDSHISSPAVVARALVAALGLTAVNSRFKPKKSMT